MGRDPVLPLCMRYQRNRGSALTRGALDPLWEGTPYALVCIYLGGGPLMGGDPSLPLCMRYQRSRGSTLARGALDPLWEGHPMPLYVFTQEGTPYGRGPLHTSLYETSSSSRSTLGRGPLDPLCPCMYLLRSGPLMGGDPSLPFCMRYQGSRGSTLDRGPPDPS